MSEANHRDSDREAVAKKEGSEGNLGSLEGGFKRRYAVTIGSLCTTGSPDISAPSASLFDS
jgi:hypothetical protein